MTLAITITTQLQTGTGFAVTADGEQAFVPAHIMACYNLCPGHKYEAYVEENTHPNNRARWRVYGIDTGDSTSAPVTAQPPAPAPARQPAEMSIEVVEAKILALLADEEVFATPEVVEAVFGSGVSATDPRYTLVTNKLHSMHKAGRIAAASVRASGTQQRASFYLFAKSTECF